MKLSLPSMLHGSQDSNDGDFKRTGPEWSCESLFLH